MAALARQDTSIFPFSSPHIFCLEEKNVDGAAGRNRPFPEEKKMAMRKFAELPETDYQKTEPFIIPRGQNNILVLITSNK